MIIDFTVTNFRSIKNEQIFSLYVPALGEHLSENVSYPIDNKIGVLKSAGFYGANASGKSNLLQAFYALQYMIKSSGDLKEGDNIPCYEPYLLAEETKSAPVHFEIEFCIPHTEKTLRYRYCVAFIASKIVDESLVFYPSTQKAIIFEREADDTWQTIKFGSLYKGGKKRLPFFANNAYLAKAGDSADTPTMIRDVYNYFRKDLIHLGIHEMPHQLNWLEDKQLVNKVASLLSLVDTGISSLEIQENSDIDEIKMKLFDNLPEDIKSQILKDQKYKASFLHLSETGDNEIFEEEQESSGTQKLFKLAPLIFEILSKGGVLIMDELDNSMHPFMAELIIKLFNDPHVNKSNAQLIFSTHNINLMSAELLRRDQIWLVEKQQGASRFFSVDDFDKKKVKPQSPFNQWYAEGRFGAIPAINYQGIVNLFAVSGEMNAEKKSKPPLDLKPILHIYCEGEKTEPNYLNGYLNRFHSSNRRLKVIKIEKTKKNTPVQLVDVAIKAKKATPDNDIFWVVYDRESTQKYSDNLHAKACGKAKAKGIKIALSNVCFEIWLLLHFQNSVATYNCYDDLRNNSVLRNECKKRGLKDYDKSERSIFSLFTNDEIKQARLRARRMNTQTKRSASSSCTKPYQWNPYTNIHHLFHAINKFSRKK